MKRELDLMLAEARVRVLYHAMLDEVETVSGVIRSLSVLTKSGRLRFRGRYFIDTTGDAELSFKAGVACEFGRPSDGLAHP
jgi:hypothetical protein